MLLLLCLACIAPPKDTSTGREPGRPPHLILISIDTLRADHLGVYGYARETSPHLDRLSQESLVFERALAPTPWTFPSHAAMLSGMHPYEIGIEHSRRTLPSDVPMLAEQLSERGYQTAAFVDSHAKGFVGSDRGFGRGFEHYAHAPHREGLPIRFDIEATVDAAITWLEGRQPDQPFFLFLHTKAVHAVPNDAECQDPRCFPYDNPQRFRFVSSEEAPYSWTSESDGAGQRFLWSLNAKILDRQLDPDTYPQDRLDVLKALYDSGIYHVDQELGRLFATLESSGLAESTGIVVTSDHGEAFLDHSLFMHQEVYEEVLRVPLIVKPPGGAESPKRVASEVALRDVAPSLAGMAAAKVPDLWTGRALPGLSLPGTGGPSSKGSAEPRPFFGYYLFPSKFEYRSFAWQEGDWKLVVHNVESPREFRQELYNIRQDPREQDPVTDRDGLRASMLRSLREQLAESPISQGPSLDEEEMPDLEAILSLGYIE